MHRAPDRRWKAVPERDPKALLRAGAIAARAAAGFVFGGLVGTFMFPWDGPLALRNVAAGLVASGTYGALLGVILPVAGLKARTSSLSLIAVHGLAATSGALAGAAWWLIASTDVSLPPCVVVGAVVGMLVLHG